MQFFLPHSVYKLSKLNDGSQCSWTDTTSNVLHKCESRLAPCVRSCRLYVNQVDYFIVGVSYKSPDADDNEIQQLFDCTKSATNLNCPLVIMRDFNYPGIDWEQLKADTIAGTKFVKLVMDCFLEQRVYSPTRGNNILDLVLTNELEQKGDVLVMAPVDNSDHNILVWEMDCTVNTTLSNRTKLLCDQADYDAMRHFMKEKLDNMNSASTSARAMWDNFNSICLWTLIRCIMRVKCRLYTCHLPMSLY